MFKQNILQTKHFADRMARKKNASEMNEDEEIIDYGEEPDFDDPEGFVDDITDEVGYIFFQYEIKVKLNHIAGRTDQLVKC